MFTWLKQRIERRKAEQRGRELYAALEGSHAERCSIVGLMNTIEAERVAKQRESLTPDSQMIFMIAYECCAMWAIKSGIETVLDSQGVRSAVLAMQRHLVKHGWYQRGVFEKIWAEIEHIMPFAMSRKPDAPPPYPLAEMVMAVNQAGYPLDPMMATDLEFGIYVLVMIQQLHEIARMAAREHLQGRNDCKPD